MFLVSVLQSELIDPPANFPVWSLFQAGVSTNCRLHFILHTFGGETTPHILRHLDHLEVFAREYNTLLIWTSLKT